MAGIVESQIFDSAATLIYVFIPNGTKINARVATKRNKQIATLKQMCDKSGKSFAWGQSIVRDGIKAKFKKPVETVLNDMLFKDGVSGIGSFMVILGTILSVAPIIMQLLVALKILPADFNLAKIVPSESDFNGDLKDPNGIGWGGGASEAGIDNTLLYVGGAVIAYTLYKSAKKQK
jgi:hypothetical protein